MKRMLTSAIALVLLAAVLSGCTASQNLPQTGKCISMTIAETLPSCVAFEYREPGQAYCFYAYDTEGSLYRVLWTDFEGLHEKDHVVVEYSDRKELTYTDYPDGGWTPQYEITATHVTLERDALASCLTHKDDVYTLTLPQSGKTLTLTEEQERFLPYITDALVAEAEKKITQEVAGYGNNSGFYLQINEDFLCLVCEVIHYTEAPDGSDHEHLFYGERISTQAVKAEAKPEVGFTKGTVLYRSGGQETLAMSTLLWSKRDNGDGTFTETAVDKYDVADLVNGKTPISAKKIPTLLLDGPVTPYIPVNGQIERVSLLTEGADGFTKSDTTFDALSDLAQGTYYVVVYVLLSGNCDPDAPQHSFRYEDVFRLEVREPTNTVRFLHFDYGISTKTLPCTDIGYAIMDALRTMRETGETVGKLSDDVLDPAEFNGELPVERGTMWIEAEGLLYRLTPDLSQICRVETHFGEGRVLEMSESFRTDVSNAWQYAPFDYYKGTYHSGDGTVELQRVFASSSSVELHIRSIHLEKKWDPHNTITVELLSKVDQTAAVKLHCEQSDDNLASGDGKIVELREGVAETVELTFGGWENSRYWIYIAVDNTIAEITIEP